MVYYQYRTIIQAMISMKAKSSQTRKKLATRKQIGKVHISATATGLTSQAGLIPVVKYLCRIGFEKIVCQTIPHQRGDNADYQLNDGILFTLVGMIGGATSIAKLCAVWSDGVLRDIAGWNKVPVDSTIGRLFKEVTEKKKSASLKASRINYADTSGARLIARVSPKLASTRFNGSILILPLIRCAAHKRVLPKATTPRRKAHSPIIRNWRFWRAAKKYCKPGLEPGAPIPAMASLNSSSNCWRIYLTECASSFAPIVVILSAPY